MLPFSQVGYLDYASTSGIGSTPAPSPAPTGECVAASSRAFSSRKGALSRKEHRRGLRPRVESTRQGSSLHSSLRQKTPWDLGVQRCWCSLGTFV